MKINNKNGFSMVELMTALGILSALMVVIMYAQRASQESTGDLKVSSDVNNLVQTLTAELSRAETCKTNFGGLPITRGSIADIRNKSGVAIVTQNSIYGEQGGATSKEMRIGVISSAAGTANHMNLTVNYTPHKKAARVFVIPITVFTDGTGNIKNCFSDIQTSIENAIANSCLGNGGRYFPGAAPAYGRCYMEFELRNSATDPVTPPVGNSYLCPAGEFLQQVDITTSPGMWTFKCSKMVTTACGAWKYLTGIDSSGNQLCQDIRDLFSGNGVMVLENTGTYKVIPITCPGSGNTTQVLQSINANGTLNCVNPRLNLTCPANQYVTGVNASGTPTCSYTSNTTVCASGSQYIGSVDINGAVTCKTGELYPACASTQYISGINASGGVICATMP